MPPISEGINGWLSSTEFFKSLLLSFSPNLDEFNPDIPEWRQDVGRVIKKALLQVSDFIFFVLSFLSFPSSATVPSLFISPPFAVTLLFLNYFLHSYYLCPPPTHTPTPWAHLCGKRELWGQTSNYSSNKCWNVSAFFFSPLISFISQQ